MSRRALSIRALGGVVMSFACTLPALAGNVMGNSGHAVVCRDDVTNAITKVELLDFYLAREVYFRDIDLGSSDLGLFAKVEVALDRLQRLDPNRSALYQRYLAEFPREMRLVQGPLPDQIDIYVPPGLPRNCTVQQLAVRRRDINLPVDTRYVVDRELWDRLPADDRAGLVIHEIVYRDSTKRGGDGFGYTARYLTGLFSSRDLDDVSEPEYQGMMLRRYMVGHTVGRADLRWTLFDDVALTLSEAQSWCWAIGDGARLAIYDDWIVLPNLAIARHIQESHPDGYVDAWFGGPEGGELYRLERDRGAVVSGDPNERHAFVCMRHD